MPFVRAKVSCGITEEQEILLKSRIGRAIGQIPGKSEAYLLLSFEDNCRMWLRGEKDPPAAYIEAAIFGNVDHRGFDRFAREATEAFSEVLGIRADRIYIQFEDISSWSVGGQFLDRRMFG